MTCLRPKVIPNPVGFSTSLPPTVTGVSPSIGATSGETLVTITGTNLTGTRDVRFNGVSGTDVNVINDTTVTCLTPKNLKGSIYVSVSVIGPSFSSGFITSSNFSYNSVLNGYDFIIIPNSSYMTPFLTISITAKSIDGAVFNASYFIVITDLATNAYPPFVENIELDDISISRFTGEIDIGLLSQGNGQIFFSPALLESNTGTSIDIDKVEFQVSATDSYSPDLGTNNRPFLWGPPLASPPARIYPSHFDSSNYIPTWNSWNTGPTVAPYGFLKTTNRQVYGVFTDKSVGPPYPETIILY